MKKDKVTNVHNAKYLLGSTHTQRNGSIQLVKITKDGLPQLKYVNPFQSNEAETMAKGIGIKTLNKEDNSQNRVVCFSNEGYIKIEELTSRRGLLSFMLL